LLTDFACLLTYEFCCHRCMLQNPVLNQGLYTISRDLVMVLY
jgi:hypothetical protein